MMLKLAPALSALLLLAACGGVADGGTPAPAPATTPGASEGAVYIVPISDPELAPHSTYAVAGFVHFAEVGGVARLEYDLPVELTGVAQRVEMTGPLDAATGAYLLTGPAGTASCRLSSAGPTSGTLQCDEKLPGVLVDLPAMRAAVAGRADAALRFRVAERFSVDPIGILRAPRGSMDDHVNAPEQEPGRKGRAPR